MRGGNMGCVRAETIGRAETMRMGNKGLFLSGYARPLGMYPSRINPPLQPRNFRPPACWLIILPPTARAADPPPLQPWVLARRSRAFGHEPLGDAPPRRDTRERA